jgi:hypothetical protein
MTIISPHRAPCPERCSKVERGHPGRGRRRRQLLVPTGDNYSCRPATTTSTPLSRCSSLDELRRSTAPTDSRLPSSGQMGIGLGNRRPPSADARIEPHAAEGAQRPTADAAEASVRMSGTPPRVPPGPKPHGQGTARLAAGGGRRWHDGSAGDEAARFPCSAGAHLRQHPGVAPQRPPQHRQDGQEDAGEQRAEGAQRPTADAAEASVRMSGTPPRVPPAPKPHGQGTARLAAGGGRRWAHLERRGHHGSSPSPGPAWREPMSDSGISSNGSSTRWAAERWRAISLRMLGPTISRMTE